MKKNFRSTAGRLNPSATIKCLLLVLACLGGMELTASAANDFSFYDPSRPGRRLVDSMIVPENPAGGKGKQVKIYTLLDYANDMNTALPDISATLNGKPVSVKLQARQTPGTPRWVKIKAEVPPADLTYAKNGAANTFKVVATLRNGTKIERQVTITGVTIPETEKDRVMGSYLESTGFKYAMAYRFPPSPLNLTTFIPTMGKYGINFQLNGRMNISPFEETASTESTGQGGIVLGDEEYTLEVGTKDSSTWQNNKWEKTESKLYVGLSTSFILWEKDLLSVLPNDGKKALDHIPFLGPKFKKTLEQFNVALTLDPSLSGTIDLPLNPYDPDAKFQFKSIDINGELDLKLAASAVLELQGFGKFGAQVMVGGKIDLDMVQPGQGFKSLSAEVYVGADFYFLAFESKMRYTLVEFHYPPTPQGRMPTSAAPQEVTQDELELVPPPDANEQIQYPLAPRLRGGAPQAGAQDLTEAKAKFRQLGMPQRLMRGALLKSSAASNGDPVKEASAVLPLAENTTSVAWPSMASHVKSNGTLILFGVDTRKPGSTATEDNKAQFTELRWMYGKNGDWTVPAPMPKGNGAAQIAPSVAALAPNKAEYLAAWQQLEDPNFKGTDAKKWLNQTQVAVGVFQAEDDKGAKVNKWTTQMLGVPGRADMAPKVAGNLGEKLDEGLVTWISASIPEVEKNDGKSMPDGAEFRWAMYKNGKWEVPGPKTVYPKVPKGMLSWDYGVRMFGGFLVYSEDIGDGNSRIMFYIYSHLAKDPSQVWLGPVELSNVKGKNLNPKVVTSLHDGKGMISVVWTENDNLVVKTIGGTTNTKEILRAATDGVVPPEATVTTLHKNTANDAGMAVSWTEELPTGPSIMTSVFDPNIKRWSKPLAITPGEDLETLYTASTDAAGNLVPLYVHTDVNYGDVQAPDENGKMVTVRDAPILGREKIMIGRFRPTRDLGFAPGGLTAVTEDFTAGTKAKLTARVESKGMLGFPSVGVQFYLGNPKIVGSKLIASGTSTKPLAGGDTVDISAEWKLPDDVWDREDAEDEEIYAVIKKPEGVTEWNPDNNVARLRVDEIVLSAETYAERANEDGSADVDVTIHNAGYPYTDPFPVKIYDYSGARLIAEEMVPKVTAGGVTIVNIALPKDAVQGANGADFLVKLDPDNTLKLPGSPKVETKVHIASAVK